MCAHTIACLFIFLRFGSIVFSNGQNDADRAKPFAGDKVIRVIPKNEKELSVLQSLEDHPIIEVDFWKGPVRVGLEVDLHVSSDNYRKVSVLLKQKGIQFTIQIHDVQRVVDLEQPDLGRSSGSFFTRYHTLEEINEELRRMATHSMVKRFSLGTSYEGREQLAVEVKGKQFPGKPVFFINCGMHAREWITPATCMYIIKQFTTKYGDDALVTKVLDKMDFVIMPVLNVDGYVFTWTRGGRMWRKTRKRNRNSRYCVGTDPNRNWDYMWGGVGASRNPCRDSYRGSRAFSEKEVVNVVNYLKRRRVKGYIDVHAYSQLWMIPWGYSSRTTRDHRELMRVSNIAVNALRTTSGTRYKVGPISTIIYPASGSSVDYTYGVLGIKYSFALELRDTGRYGFMLPPSQIIPTGEETFNGVLALVNGMKV